MTEQEEAYEIIKRLIYPPLKQQFDDGYFYCPYIPLQILNSYNKDTKNE